MLINERACVCARVLVRVCVYTTLGVGRSRRHTMLFFLPQSSSSFSASTPILGARFSYTGFAQTSMLQPRDAISTP